MYIYPTIDITVSFERPRSQNIKPTTMKHLLAMLVLGTVPFMVHVAAYHPKYAMAFCLAPSSVNKSPRLTRLNSAPVPLSSMSGAAAMQKLRGGRAVAGKLSKGILGGLPILSRIKKAVSDSATAASETLVGGELVAVSLLAFGTVPLMRSVYHRINRNNTERKFKGSLTSFAAHFIAQAGKTLLLVYFLDIAYAVGLACGLPLSNPDLPREIGIFTYTVWATRVIRSAKRSYIWHKDMTSEQKVFFNRICNVLITTVAVLILFGELSTSHTA